MSLIFNGTTVENVVYNGTALCKLVYNGTLVWENHAYGSWSTTTAATCTATGSKKRTCTRTGCGVSETQSIPATGHNYTGTVYGWASDNSTCTARRICSNDSSHIETATATATYKVTTAATCTTTGTGTYTAEFTSTTEWRLTTQTKTKSIPATGHSWNAPTYTWSGNTSCTATRTCKNNSSHTETATATITNAITTAATCTTEGVKTYTATFSESWATAQTKTVTIPATGHSYGLPMYVWNGYTSCTATRNCSKDSSHKETATATISSKVTKAATCTATGTRTYTATFSKSWASTQTKTETIPTTGHTSVAYPYVAPTTTSIGYTGGTYCSTCGTVLTARSKILATPVFANMSFDPGLVSISVKNNNPVSVNCFVIIYDDVGTALYDGSYTISANDTGTKTISIASSAVPPIEISVYFEASGYNDSDWEDLIAE